MELPINAPITCTDGAGGHSTAIILNPVSERITHLVVREPGLLGIERMIPIELVTASTPEQIQLHCTKGELAQMSPFISNHYLPPAAGFVGVYGAGIMLWPFMSDQSQTQFNRENVSVDELTIHRGAHVHATDGHIGEVEEFLVNPTNSSITHLVLREGHLWNKQDVTIPITEIDHMEDNRIFLTLNKQQIEALPARAIAKQVG
ncbi:MAG: hypothetical protein SH847_05265 [Roseiflexaceae bacterium]|nr:hypothetical protein [Roseiflexaceae bacterium]